MTKKCDETSNLEQVVVSGGTRGLGLQIVLDLLESGMRVSTFGRQSTPEMTMLAEKHPESFHFQVFDLANDGSPKELVSEFQNKLGPIFALINNAATVQEGILATLPEVNIARMIAVNLEGTIRLTRACLKDMIYRKRGRVINISSIVGQRGYNGLTVYSATKAGLDGFTRSLAREAGRRSITVNSIAPGYMETEMSAGLTNQSLDQIIRRTPLNRLATPRDITPLVVFLLSDNADFITGQTILVDGGISN
jgi:3-oxoacyl-[acyl-carrier protein] reductase